MRECRRTHTEVHEMECFHFYRVLFKVKRCLGNNDIDAVVKVSHFAWNFYLGFCNSGNDGIISECIANKIR